MAQGGNHFVPLRFQEGRFRGYCEPTGIAYRSGYLFIADASRTRLLISRVNLPHMVVQQFDLVRAFGDGGLHDVAYAPDIQRFFVLLDPASVPEPRVGTFRVRMTPDQGFALEERTTGILRLAGARCVGQIAVDPAGSSLSAVDATCGVLSFALGNQVFQRISPHRPLWVESGKKVPLPWETDAIAVDGRHFLAIRQATKGEVELISFVSGDPRPPRVLANFSPETTAVGVAASRTVYYIVSRNSTGSGGAIVSIPQLVLGPDVAAP